MQISITGTPPSFLEIEQIMSNTSEITVGVLGVDKR